MKKNKIKYIILDFEKSCEEIKYYLDYFNLEFGDVIVNVKRVVFEEEEFLFSFVKFRNKRR